MHYFGGFENATNAARRETDVIACALYAEPTSLFARYGYCAVG